MTIEPKMYFVPTQLLYIYVRACACVSSDRLFDNTNVVVENAFTYTGVIFWVAKIFERLSFRNVFREEGALYKRSTNWSTNNGSRRTWAVQITLEDRFRRYCHGTTSEL